MNYKELDTQRIKDYIQSYPDGVEVEDAGVSGPVRTGAGGMARGDGTGGAGESEKGESQIANIKYKILG